MGDKQQWRSPTASTPPPEASVRDGDVWFGPGFRKERVNGAWEPVTFPKPPAYPAPYSDIRRSDGTEGSAGDVMVFDGWKPIWQPIEGVSP